MCVSVEYFDGELPKPLNPNNEEWGFVTGPIRVDPSCTYTAAEKNVKQAEA